MPTSWVSEEDPLWSKPCLAYNLHAELDDACRKDLVEVQERLQLPASWALRCPAASLHVSVATLLSVREEYGTSKDLIWARWGRQWCENLGELVAGLQPFEIRFTRLQISSAAVVALAEPVLEVDQVRGRATHLLSSAGIPSRQPSILHCTLVRYGASGEELAALASSVRRVELSAGMMVEHLVVSRELVYPSLVSESLDLLQLRTTAPVVTVTVPRDPSRA